MIRTFDKKPEKLVPSVSLPICKSAVSKLIDDDEVVNIECNGFRKITQVTSQHPVLVLNKHNKLTTTYVDAGELTVNNYLAFPIPEDLTDLNIYTDDDCYFYGYFMYYGTEVNNNQISLHEKYFSPKVKNYLDTNFTYEKEGEYYIITSYKLVTIKYQLLQLSNSKLSNLIKKQRLNKINLISNGDDYQVLFTADIKKARIIQKASKTTGIKITKIGKIVSGKDRSLIFDEKGKQIRAKSKGYIHQF